MSFFKLLFNANNSEGCREAMRMSYRKHLNSARQKAEQNAHHIGLFGALGSRYRITGMYFNEAEVWGELTPFLFMDEADSIEALAEYAVYKEKRYPDYDAKASWLKKLINEALEKGVRDRKIFNSDTISRFAWYDLVDFDVKYKLKKTT